MTLGRTVRDGSDKYWFELVLVGVVTGMPTPLEVTPPRAGRWPVALGLDQAMVPYRGLSAPAFQA